MDDARVLRFIRDLPAPTKAVITTRHRIDGAISLSLQGLAIDNALALVNAEVARRDIELNDNERLAIAKESGGVPLAIIWTVAQVACGSELERVLLRLRSAKGDYARFCFAESLQFLQNNNYIGAIKALMALSLFASSGTREALGFVSGLHELPDERDKALRLVTDLSLVHFTGDRFFLLPLTKEYAAAEMKRDLEFESFAVQRWYEWHLRITARAGRGGSDLDSSVLKELEPEHENIVWAVDQACRSEATLATFVRLLRNVEFYWLETGRWREFELYLEKGRRVAPEPVDRIHFTGRLVWMYVLRGDLDKARELVDEARKLLQRFPSEYESMRIEDFEGQLEFEKGNWDKAKKHFLSSLRLAAKLGDRRGLFACNKYLGDVHCTLGKVALARKHLHEAEKYVGEPGEGQWLRGKAFAAHLRGLILQTERDWSGAEQAFQECIDYLGFHTDIRLLCRARHGLALAKFHRGSREAAADLLRNNLNTSRRLAMWAKAKETEELLARVEAGAELP